MKKKMIPIFVMLLMIAISVLPAVETTNVNMKFNDQLDQQQTICDYRATIGYNDREGAQSFKPTLGTLTRIELYITEREPALNNFVVSIKKDGLKTFDLTSISVSPGFIPDYPDVDWVEFDFPDIQVTPEQTYYIVARAENGADNYHWGMRTLADDYDRGYAFYKWEDSDYLWEEWGIADWCFKTYGVDNLPPDKPSKPLGESNGKTGVSYVYSSSAIDPDGDQIYYKFDWGDGTDSGWLGKYNSGEICEAAHSWESEGTYPVKVIAKDDNGEESVWSDSLSVSMPKNKAINLLFWLFLERLIERFPILEQILQPVYDKLTGF